MLILRVRDPCLGMFCGERDEFVGPFENRLFCLTYEALHLVHEACVG